MAENENCKVGMMTHQLDCLNYQANVQAKKMLSDLLNRDDIIKWSKINRAKKLVIFKLDNVNSQELMLQYDRYPLTFLLRNTNNLDFGTSDIN